MIGHGHVTQCYLNKDRFSHHPYVIHSVVPCLHVLLVPEWCTICGQIACYSYMSF
jgi:hypothetical protein